MRKLIILGLLLSACATTTSTTSVPATQATTQATVASTIASTTTTAPSTTTSTLATTTTTLPPLNCPMVDVILVASNDVLNVRTAPNPSSQILFTLPYNATNVYTTSTAAQVYNGTEWWEIHEPLGQNVGWASSFYLACQQSGFATSPQPGQILAGLAQHAAGSTSAPAWSSLVSPYGLTVEHFEPATKYWPATQNPFLDPTQYQWATEAGGPNSLQATFGAQIGTLWLDGVLNDTLGTLPAGPLPDQTQQGAEAAPPWSPLIFTNLHYLSVFDPADNPNNAGLDWRTVYAYFDWTTANGWRLRGLSFDSWAP